MKNILQSVQVFTLTLLMAATAGLKAQSLTGIVVTQPCNNNGQISVTATGLTPPIDYTYYNWVSNQTIVHNNINSLTNSLSGIAAYQTIGWSNPNSWNVSATDGTNTYYTTVTLNPPFTDSIDVIPAICPALSTVQAAYFSGGTAPYSVVWTNLSSSTSYSANPATVPNGLYIVTITDAAGCMVTSAPNPSFNINVMSSSNISVGMTGSNANCTNGIAQANPSGGTAPYTYLWNNNATSQNISGLTQGQYNCTVTDAIGCQSIGYYWVQQAVTINYNSSITNATCLQNNGSVLSFINGGTTPYTFLWSNGQTTQNISGVQGGQYSVQITDANGCTGMGYVYVNVSTPISVTYTASPSSCTSATGAATITATGGAAPYNIVWTSFSPVLTGASISSKPSGTYQFVVTDANGCIKSGSVFIPPASTINALINNSSVICPATTGNLQVSVSGTNGPFTYLWSNAATSAIITGVSTGYYSCVITDAAGCSVTKGGSVIQTSPITVGFNSTPATCIFSNDGSVMANALGGTAPYTYLWSNSQTGATATGLATGYYYVTVTDANGCTNNYPNNMVFVGYNPANNSCYCTVTGTVYADANTNCVKNSGENGIQNVQIHCSGFGYAYTNSNGVYSFKVPTGTYTVSQTVQQNYPLASCQTNNQVVSVTAAANCVSTVDFANTVIPIHDLHLITCNVNWPIPGNTYNQKVILQNDGTITENTIKIGYAHDGQLGYSSCTPWALTQQNSTTYPNWYSITTGFGSLNAGASSVSYINYNVPTNIPLNTVVNFNDSAASAAPIATSWLTDNTPWNNVNSHQVTVIGSYDPNFKEVSPKGNGPQGEITKKDSMLTYVVHFQNTGSYFAQNIVVVDSLDSDLDLKTLRPGYSDHNYTTTMNENGVIKFHFNNINLPWQSAYGDVLSSGMFVYSVKMKKNLALGTQIKNKAAIYFDYNEPVITNTTLNTLVAGITSIKEISGSGADKVLLFPNPASNNFTLVFSSDENSNGIINIFDISGREISTKNITIEKGNNSITNATDYLQTGIYMVQLKTENQTVTKKIVIAK